VLVEQVDDIGVQPLQGSVCHVADMLRPAVHAALAAFGIEVEAELRGDDDLVAERRQRLTEQFLVLVGAVGNRLPPLPSW
jgi:hypothetical protein